MMYHCCLDVAYGLREKTLPIATVAMCVTAKARGDAVIPFGPCDNFDPQDGCRGHEQIDGEAK